MEGVMSQEISINPIGHVRAEGGAFEIRILPPFIPALAKLEEFSHVMILWLLFPW